MTTSHSNFWRETHYLGEQTQIKEDKAEASLVVQGLRLHTPNGGGLGLIPGQGTRSHTPQLKTPSATTNDPACHS